MAGGELLASDAAGQSEAMLNAIGCEVVFVENGQEALDKCLTGEFDLTLMDCMMPMMDGYEATRSICDAFFGGKQVPIVAMIANALQGDKEKCLQAGMDSYLAKPTRRVG